MAGGGATGSKAAVGDGSDLRVMVWNIQSPQFASNPLEFVPGTDVLGQVDQEIWQRLLEKARGVMLDAASSPRLFDLLGDKPLEEAGELEKAELQVPDGLAKWLESRDKQWRQAWPNVATLDAAVAKFCSSHTARWEVWKRQTVHDWLCDDGSGGKKSEFLPKRAPTIDDLVWDLGLGMADRSYSDHPQRCVHAWWLRRPEAGSTTKKREPKMGKYDFFKLLVWDLMLNAVLMAVSPREKIEALLPALMPGSTEERMRKVVEKVQQVDVAILLEIPGSGMPGLEELFWVVRASAADQTLNTAILARKEIFEKPLMDRLEDSGTTNARAVGCTLLYRTKVGQVHVLGVHLSGQGYDFGPMAKKLDRALRPYSVLGGDFNRDLRKLQQDENFQRDAPRLHRLIQQAAKISPDAGSTSKERSPFQAQVSKIFLHDFALKDFLFVGDQFIPAAPEGTITRERRLPDAKVPSDHAPLTQQLQVKESNLSSEIVWSDAFYESVLALQRALYLGFPVCVEGPRCSGKRTALEFYAKRVFAADVRFVQVGPHTTEAELVGAVQLAKGGQCFFRPGVLTQAVRSGCWLVLLDVNTASAAVLQMLAGLMAQLHEEPGERLKLSCALTELGVDPAADDGWDLQDVGADGYCRLARHPEFRLLLTVSTGRGMSHLPPDFTSHFVPVSFSEISEGHAMEIVGQRARGFSDEEKLLISSVVRSNLRAALSACDFVSSTKVSQELRSGVASISLKTALQVLRNASQDAALEVPAVKFPPRPDAHGRIHMAREGDSRRFAFLDVCRASGRCAALVGAACAGKAACVMRWAELRGLECTCVAVGAHTTMDDLVGTTLPVQGDPPFAWVNGPLATALQSGHVLLVIGADMLGATVRQALEQQAEGNAAATDESRKVQLNGFCEVEAKRGFQVVFTSLKRIPGSRALTLQMDDVISAVEAKALCESHGLEPNLASARNFTNLLTAVYTFRALANIGRGSAAATQTFMAAVHEFFEHGQLLSTADCQHLSTPRNDEMALVLPDSRQRLLHHMWLCKTAGVPVILEGPAAAGKTAVAIALAHAERKVGTKDAKDLVLRNRAGGPRDALVLDMSGNTTLEDLFGRFVMDQKQCIFKPGALLTALQDGRTLVINELNLAPISILRVLAHVASSPAKIINPINLEEIQTHLGYWLVATQNPTDFQGRQKLPEALRRRCTLLHVEAYTKNELAEILQSRAIARGIPEQRSELVARSIVDQGVANIRSGVKLLRRVAKDEAPEKSMRLHAFVLLGSTGEGKQDYPVHFAVHREEGTRAPGAQKDNNMPPSGPQVAATDKLPEKAAVRGTVPHPTAMSRTTEEAPALPRTTSANRRRGEARSRTPSVGPTPRKAMRNPSKEHLANCEAEKMVQRRGPGGGPTPKPPSEGPARQVTRQSPTEGLAPMRRPSVAQYIKSEVGVWVFSAKMEDCTISVKLPVGTKGFDPEVVAQVEALGPHQVEALVRMAFALRHREPILLRGPTCFKTRLAQLLSTMTASNVEEPLAMIYACSATNQDELLGATEPHVKSTFERHCRALLAILGVPEVSRIEVDALSHELRKAARICGAEAEGDMSRLHLEDLASVLEQRQGDPDGQFFRFCERGLLPRIRFGGTVCLKNMDAMDPAILEGLNSVFDVDPSIVVHGTKISVHPRFATIGIVHQRAQLCFSPAIQTRFTHVCISAEAALGELPNVISAVRAAWMPPSGHKAASKEVPGAQEDDGKAPAISLTVRRGVWLAAVEHLTALGVPAWEHHFKSGNSTGVPIMPSDGEPAGLHELLLAGECSRQGLPHPTPCLVGAPGLGKTYVCEVAAKRMGRRFVRICCSAHLVFEDLLGSLVPDPYKPTFRFVPGVLLQAMKERAFVVFDEVNLLSPEAMSAVTALLCCEGKLAVRDEVLDPRSCVYAVTMNPQDARSGRRALPEALMALLVVIQMPSLPREKAKRIVGSWPGNPSVDHVLKVYEVLNEKLAKAMAGGGDFFNVRVLQRIAAALRSQGDQEESKRSAAIYSIFTGGLLHEASVDDVAKEQVVAELSRSLSQSGPKSCKGELEVAAAASTFVLLHGPAGCGKRRLVRDLASQQGKKLVEVVLTAGTEEADLLGELVPAPGGFRFHAGPVRRAVEEGWWLLLGGADRVRPEVLERLNSLGEVGGQLHIFEQGTQGSDGPEHGTTIPVKEGFHTFFTVTEVNPTKVSTKMSRPFLNRCSILRIDVDQEEVLQEFCAGQETEVTGLRPVLQEIQAVSANSGTQNNNARSIRRLVKAMQVFPKKEAVRLCFGPEMREAQPPAAKEGAKEEAKKAADKAAAAKKNNDKPKDEAMQPERANNSAKQQEEEEEAEDGDSASEASSDSGVEEGQVRLRSPACVRVIAVEQSSATVTWELQQLLRSGQCASMADMPSERLCTEAQRLLEAKADLERRDPAGNVCLHLAPADPPLIALLLRHGKEATYVKNAAGALPVFSILPRCKSRGTNPVDISKEFENVDQDALKLEDPSKQTLAQLAGRCGSTPWERIENLFKCCADQFCREAISLAKETLGVPIPDAAQDGLTFALKHFLGVHCFMEVPNTGSDSAEKLQKVWNFLGQLWVKPCKGKTVEECILCDHRQMITRSILKATMGPECTPCIDFRLPYRDSFMEHVEIMEVGTKQYLDSLCASPDLAWIRQQPSPTAHDEVFGSQGSLLAKELKGPCREWMQVRADHRLADEDGFCHLKAPAWVDSMDADAAIKELRKLKLTDEEMRVAWHQFDDDDTKHRRDIPVKEKIRFEPKSCPLFDWLQWQDGAGNPFEVILLCVIGKAGQYPKIYQPDVIMKELRANGGSKPPSCLEDLDENGSLVWMELRPLSLHFTCLHGLWLRSLHEQYQGPIYRRIEEAFATPGTKFLKRDGAKRWNRMADKVVELVSEVTKEIHFSSEDFDEKHPTKAFWSMPEDAQEELSTLFAAITDISAFTVVFDDFVTFQQACSALLEMRWDTDGLRVVRFRNRFHHSVNSASGYRDIQVLLLVKVPESPHTPMLVEGQLHHSKIYRLKEGLMHLTYEARRGSFDHPALRHMWRWRPSLDAWLAKHAVSVAGLGIAIQRRWVELDETLGPAPQATGCVTCIVEDDEDHDIVHTALAELLPALICLHRLHIKTEVFLSGNARPVVGLRAYLVKALDESLKPRAWRRLLRLAPCAEQRQKEPQGQLVLHFGGEAKPLQPIVQALQRQNVTTVGFVVLPAYEPEGATHSKYKFATSLDISTELEERKSLSEVLVDMLRNSPEEVDKSPLGESRRFSGFQFGPGLDSEDGLVEEEPSLDVVSTEKREVAPYTLVSDLKPPIQRVDVSLAQSRLEKLLEQENNAGEADGKAGSAVPADAVARIWERTSASGSFQGGGSTEISQGKILSLRKLIKWHATRGASGDIWERRVKKVVPAVMLVVDNASHVHDMGTGLRARDMLVEVANALSGSQVLHGVACFGDDIRLVKAQVNDGWDLAEQARLVAAFNGRRASNEQTPRTSRCTAADAVAVGISWLQRVRLLHPNANCKLVLLTCSTALDVGALASAWACAQDEGFDCLALSVGMGSIPPLLPRVTVIPDFNSGAVLSALCGDSIGPVVAEVPQGQGETGGKLKHRMPLPKALKYESSLLDYDPEKLAFHTLQGSALEDAEDEEEWQAGVPSSDDVVRALRLAAKMNIDLECVCAKEAEQGGETVPFQDLYKMYEGTFHHPSFGSTLNVEVWIKSNSRGEWEAMGQKETIKITRTGEKIELAEDPGRTTVFDGKVEKSGKITGKVVQSGQSGGGFTLTPRKGSGKVQATRERTCYLGHVMEDLQLTRDNGWSCSGRRWVGGCKSNFTDFGQTGGEIRHRCQACDFDLCEKCLYAPYKVLKARPGDSVMAKCPQATSGKLKEGGTLFPAKIISRTADGKYKIEFEGTNIVEKDVEVPPELIEEPEPTKGKKSAGKRDAVGCCESGHKLEALGTSRDNGWACDGRHWKGGCRSSGGDFGETAGLNRFRCDDCDYDLCEACFHVIAKDFEIGERVEARYKLKSGKVPEKWYPGKIERGNGNGTWAVDYDDGDRWEDVPAVYIRSLDGKRHSAQETPAADDAVLEPGARVEAKWKGGKKWYTGKILKRNVGDKYRAVMDTYDVQYDDGDKDKEVPRKDIRIQEQSSEVRREATEILDRFSARIVEMAKSPKKVFRMVASTPGRLSKSEFEKLLRRLQVSTRGVKEPVMDVIWQQVVAGRAVATFDELIAYFNLEHLVDDHEDEDEEEEEEEEASEEGDGKGLFDDSDEEVEPETQQQQNVEEQAPASDSDTSSDDNDDDDDDDVEDSDDSDF